MKQRTRIYYTETDKGLMWDRWQKGDSLQTIAQLLIVTIPRYRVFFLEPEEYAHLNDLVQVPRSPPLKGKRFHEAWSLAILFAVSQRC